MFKAPVKSFETKVREAQMLLENEIWNARRNENFTAHVAGLKILWQVEEEIKSIRHAESAEREAQRIVEVIRKNNVLELASEFFDNPNNGEIVDALEMHKGLVLFQDVYSSTHDAKVSLWALVSDVAVAHRMGWGGIEKIMKSYPSRHALMNAFSAK